ncbi:MAG: hypothetical protein MZV64_71010 [Ignavibacteriales bacterium]|nr:hypothetical protein [Ignavibacteriales bacterium]
MVAAESVPAPQPVPGPSPRAHHGAGYRRPGWCAWRRLPCAAAGRSFPALSSSSWIWRRRPIVPIRPSSARPSPRPSSTPASNRLRSSWGFPGPWWSSAPCCCRSSRMFANWPRWFICRWARTSLPVGRSGD